MSPKGENYNQFQPSLSIQLVHHMKNVIVTNHHVLGKTKQLMSGSKESTTAYSLQGSPRFARARSIWFGRVIVGWFIFSRFIVGRCAPGRFIIGRCGRCGFAPSRFAFRYLIANDFAPLGPVLGFTREQEVRNFAFVFGLVLGFGVVFGFVFFRRIPVDRHRPWANIKVSAGLNILDCGSRPESDRNKMWWKEWAHRRPER